MAMNDIPWIKKLTKNGASHVGQSGHHPRPEVAMKMIAGVWAGLVINENQVAAGEPHKDQEDARKGFNCVVPWGTWTGGDLLLWELKKRVEVREGQAVFFRGSLITHDVCNINGIRHGVDFFTHQGLLDMDKNKRLHKGNQKREEEKAKKWKKEREKYRRQLKKKQAQKQQSTTPAPARES